MLRDTHDRILNYLRIAVTDRCNLRCTYCMPEEGIKYVDRSRLLTYEEIERLVALLAKNGVNKIRITGGEPFLRKGLMECIDRINHIGGINSIHITTNGTLTEDLVPDFISVGIKSVNLSLDSLDGNRFHKITRRDDLEKVLATLHQLVEADIPTKINMVVMNGQNIEDIFPMIELTKHLPINVRFLEEMPFNGNGQLNQKKVWNAHDIMSYIQEKHPSISQTFAEANSTSSNYKIPGYTGQIGIIASYSRTFCGTCNRLRLTPEGLIKTCLYDAGIFNIRDLIRAGATDEDLLIAIQSAVQNKAKDGFAAEALRKGGVSESMATIGG